MLTINKSSVLLAALLATAVNTLQADEPKGFLETIHRHMTLASTVADNGDLNPYALIVAPVSAGKIQQGDVLVDNFNKVSNLQGTGTTIMDYNPATKNITLFAELPQNLPQCPGGVGLSTAMTMLKSGWVIVGSTPSTDGTTRTRARAACWCSMPMANWLPLGPTPTSTTRGAISQPLITEPTPSCSSAWPALMCPAPMSTIRNRLSGDSEQGDGAAD